jgi:ribosome maturation factor RimP
LASEKQKIENLLRPEIEALGAQFIEFSIRGERTGKVVELFVDTDEGITAEKCVEISRRVSPILDGLDEFQGKYNLIVSSPGIDRPLKFLKQYERNIGRTISVKMKSGSSGKIEGELLEVSKNGIIVKNEKGNSQEISFSDISEAFIRPRW